MTLARALQAMGVNVVFLTDTIASKESRPRALEGLAFRQVVPPPATASYPQLLGYWSRIARALMSLRSAFDVLHVHAADFDHSAAAPLGRLMGKPVLVRSSIGGEFTNLSQSWSGRAQRQMYRAAGAFVVLSDRIAAEYIRAGLSPDRLHHVANGVDTSLYHPVSASRKAELRAALNLPTDRRILVYHGVFIERKSLHWIIECLEDLLLELDLHLLLVGGSTREAESRSYADAVELQAHSSIARDRITIRAADPQVNRYLQASDAYVLASTNEGLSNALLEAMATGLVPIVSRASGSEDVIEHGRRGWLFPARDRAGFRDAVRVALGQDTDVDMRAVSSAASEHIREEYSIQVTAQKYLRIYERLIGRRVSHLG